MQEEGAVDVVPFPPPKPFWKRIQEGFADQSFPGMGLVISAAQVAEALGLVAAADQSALEEEEDNFTRFCQPKLADHMCPKAALPPLSWMTATSQPELMWLSAACQMSGVPISNGLLLHTLAAHRYLMQMQSGGVQMMCPPVYVH